ncbi:MAG: S1 RNA-binding domain-containing protein [bacterium]|nr:S1 RNA-binding domain-containing protein [bacterium]
MSSEIISEIKPKRQTLLQQVLRDLPAQFAPLKPGEVVEGILLQKGARLLLLDLGRHGTGAVYGGELTNARELVRGLLIGSKILGKVVCLDNEDGYVELSIAEAGREKAWDEIRELQEKDEPFLVQPVGFNKGGLIIEVAGIKGFLPLSQLSPEHYPKVPDGDKQKIIQELQNLQKQKFSVKIIDANSKTDKLIFSERAAAEENMKELAKGYSVGQVVTGIVSGVASFGAFFRFADNPKLEGLIHISELDHRLVENPKEVVSLDDSIQAKIIEIKDGKVYLSLKALKADPWESAGTTFHAGQEARGKVYAFHPFGAVIDLGGLQGQIHVAEFGGVLEMKGALKEGETYSFIVSEVRPEEKRIFLKLKK